MQKGEITAFLSLVFLLMVSFIGAMVESASIQVLKNSKRADVSLAMESVFAEYQKELLENYDIFALDGSYGTGTFDEKNIVRRLAYYGAEDTENEIQRFELLTDMEGAAFYAQAVQYMENKMGLDEIKEEENSFWKEQEKEADHYQQEDKKIQNSLDSMLEDSEEKLPDKNNPIQSITQIQKSSLLQVIIQDSEQLSNKSVKKEELASSRKLNKGKGSFSTHLQKNGVLEKMFFTEYLLEHFSDITQVEKNHVLDYELEYLIAGYDNDQKNLETVIKKILAIRVAINYAYLLTDEGKKAEAEVLALTLCSVLTVPGITEIVKQAILLAWSYGEGIVDLRQLIKGQKVPVTKNIENWNLQLSGLFQLGEKKHEPKEQIEEGITYRDYLKGLLLLEKKEQLSMRALDLIEGILKIKSDACVMHLNIESRCKLRRGIQYQFCTYFGYQ